MNACLTCHADQAEQHKKKNLHQPAFEQSCAICHEPHGGDNEHLLRVKSANALCLECHGPERSPKKLEAEHLITIFGDKVRLPENYMTKAVVLPLKYGRGHPTKHHPVVDQMDPTDNSKVRVAINCLTCHQPHLRRNRVCWSKTRPTTRRSATDATRRSTSNKGMAMLSLDTNSMQRKAGAAALAIALSVLALTGSAFCDKKKKKEADKPKPNLMDILDLSKIVWPNPPAIARIRYMNYFCAQKPPEGPDTKKAKWMDRLAGVAVGEQVTTEKRLWQLVTPYGMAVDSKNRLYVADSKVHAIFIFDTETKDLQLIKNGVEARFGLITGLAIDDSDRLFVSDSEMRRVMVFDPTHKAEGSISEGLASPAGLAVDNENRFLYVADPDLDQVLVYDADPPHKLLRKLGTGGESAHPDYAWRFLDADQCSRRRRRHLYVTDTWNNRVEIFDPDGKFIRDIGQGGRRPGILCAPEGNRNRRRRACLGSGRHAGPGAGVFARRPVVDLDGWPRRLSGQFKRWPVSRSTKTIACSRRNSLRAGCRCSAT